MKLKTDLKTTKKFVSNLESKVFPNLKAYRLSGYGLLYFDEWYKLNRAKFLNITQPGTKALVVLESSDFIPSSRNAIVEIIIPPVDGDVNI